MQIPAVKPQPLADMQQPATTQQTSAAMQQLAAMQPLSSDESPIFQRNYSSEFPNLEDTDNNDNCHIDFNEDSSMYFFLFFFVSGLWGPKSYSLWGGVVPSPSIGYEYP